MPCTTILVGKKASHDGSTIIARNDDGGFEAKRLLVHPAREGAATYRTVLSHLTVALPEKALRYTDCPNVSKTNGVWPACGINEANVAMTATETITSNPRVVGADPYVRYQEKKGRGSKEVPGGIGEEDLVTLVLPYIRSAREGVLRTGALLEQYGTYEPNGMAFADADEIWWLETIGGHHWIARRVPDDRVVIMPNQFGLDHFDFADAYGEKKEHLCSQDLREFVEKYRLALDAGAAFNPRLAFGSHSDADHIYNTPRAWFMARYFLPRTHQWDGENADFTPQSNDIPWSFVPEHKVTVEDVRYLLGSYYQGIPLQPLRQDRRLQGQVPHHRRAQQRRLRHYADPRRSARGGPGRGVAVHGRQWLHGLLPGLRQCDRVPQIPERHHRNRLHRQHVLAQPDHRRADRRPLRQRPDL